MSLTTTPPPPAVPAFNGSMHQYFMSWRLVCGIALWTLPSFSGSRDFIMPVSITFNTLVFLKFIFIYLKKLCVFVFCLQMCLCIMHVRCPQRPKEGIGSSEIGVTDNFKMLSAGNPTSILEEQQNAFNPRAISPGPM